MLPQQKKHWRTLWLCGALHAFTHIYQVALIPLYLLIQRDLQMKSVEGATLLVTVMGLAYFLPSYLMGILADRMSRRKLLAAGLLLNGVGYIGISMATSYPALLGCVIFAGIGGSFFHPAATSLVARLFPENTGKALGWLGIGASTGFFFGPLYAGWRAAVTGNWRAPIFELGLLGIIAAALFFWLADEDKLPGSATKPFRIRQQLFSRPALWIFFLMSSLAFSLRDFAGSGAGSLTSLFLQKAHGYGPKIAGIAISVIFLASAISNPLFGGLSDRGRVRWITFVLISAAITLAILPHVPRAWFIPLVAVYGFFFLASYPMVEAAIMESVDDALRGRVFGLFITAGGLFGNLSHWAMGAWVKRLGPNGAQVESYFPLFGLLSLFILISLAGLPCLMQLRRQETISDSVPSPATAAPAP